MALLGRELLAKNIIRFGGGFTKHVDKTMRKVVNVVSNQVDKNISRTDYSLDELKHLDHPFASRHGRNGTPIFEPYWMAHERSGSLRRSLFTDIEPASVIGGRLKSVGFVGLDKNKSKHAEMVIYGTSKMIPRPVMVGSLNQKKKEVKAVLSKELKNFTFNYR